MTGWDERDSRRVNVGPDLTYPGTFSTAVDAQLPTLNAFYALHMTGRWRQVVVRNLYDERVGRLKEVPTVGADETPVTDVTPETPRTLQPEAP